MARQVLTADHRTHQEAAQADHPVEMIPTLLVAPSDPSLTRRNPERCCLEPGGPKPAMGRTHEVANLAAGKGGHPVGMFVGDQPVPQRPLIGLATWTIAMSRTCKRCPGTPTASGTGASRTRGLVSLTPDRGCGKTMSGDVAASAANAFMHPET